MGTVSKRTLNYFKETFGGDEEAIQSIWNAGYRHGLKQRVEANDDQTPVHTHPEAK